MAMDDLSLFTAIDQTDDFAKLIGFAETDKARRQEIQGHRI